MPTYHVLFSTASDGSGSSFEASLNAPSLPALVLRLQEHGHRLLQVRARQPDRALRAYRTRITDVESATLLRHLALHLEGGVSLPAALEALARETRNFTLKAMLLDLGRAVSDGDTLSSALGTYPRLFTSIHVGMLEAAEAGNRLPEALRQLAEYGEQVNQADQRIRTALVYPQVVGVFTLVIMSVILVFTVPKFRGLFQELGVKEFPLPTQVLFWMAGSGFGWGVLGTLLLFAIGWSTFRMAEGSFPFQLSYLRTRVPVLGALYHNFALLRLVRLLASLLDGGIPLLEALRLAGQGSGNLLLQAAMWDAIPHAAAGETLAEAFSHAGILPASFCAQISAAESSGELPAALRRLANWYGDRVDYLAARVGAMLEPALIVVLAGMASVVALGVFAPLVSILQSLSGGSN